MQIEHHTIGDIYARRFKAGDPRYALPISHAIALIPVSTTQSAPRRAWRGGPGR
jgi:hypothetical protein